MWLRNAGFAGAVFCVAVTAFGGIRDEKRMGVIATYSPNAQLVGPGLGVNPFGWFRLEAGYVVPSSSPRKFPSTLETNAKFLNSDWDTSPYVGLGSGPQSGQLALIFGLDYTANNGINVGGGYSHVSASGASSIQIYGGYYF